MRIKALEGTHLRQCSRSDPPAQARTIVATPFPINPDANVPIYAALRMILPSHFADRKLIQKRSTKRGNPKLGILDITLARCNIKLLPGLMQH